jgi:aspartokinase-like uncharacterized kinase
MSDPSATRVIKLGGSLLDLPDLAGQLKAWLARQPLARNLIVTGGGRFVDELRRLDRLHHPSQESCHWLAIRAMSLTANLLHALAPDWPIITRLDGLAGAPGRTAILDPWDFLHAEESSPVGQPLPHSWDVTSDSIAARVARRIDAVELVLLKSSLPPQPCDRRQAAELGCVDPYFPQESHNLPVRCADFRHPHCSELWLPSEPGERGA